MNVSGNSLLRKCILKFVFKSNLKYFLSGAFVLLSTLLNASMFARLPAGYEKFERSPLSLASPLKMCRQIEYGKTPPKIGASDNVNELYLSFISGKIESINLTANTITWSSVLGGEIVSPVIYEDAKIFFVTEISNSDFQNVDHSNQSDRRFTEYVVWSLDAKTGVTLWRFSYKYNNFKYLTLYQNNIFLFSSEGNVLSINKYNADRVFSVDLMQSVTFTPDFFDNKIYVGVRDNLILVLSVANGEVISKIPTGHSPAVNIVSAKNQLIWGDKTGKINSFDLPAKKRTWSKQYGGEISSLQIIQNNLFVSSFDNFVYMVSLPKGRALWKKRLDGRVLFKPLILGDYALITTSGGSNAIVLDLKNGDVINRITSPDSDFAFSAPVVAGNLLVFPTSKGYTAFSEANLGCD